LPKTIATTFPYTEARHERPPAVSRQAVNQYFLKHSNPAQSILFSLSVQAGECALRELRIKH
jgi:hypothetical protein